MLDKEQEILDFINKFKDKSNDELGEIIRNHNNYKLAAIKAAIIILEQRGYYSTEKLTELFNYFETEKKREKERERGKTDMPQKAGFFSADKIIIAILFLAFMAVRSCAEDSLPKYPNPMEQLLNHTK